MKNRMSSIFSLAVTSLGDCKFCLHLVYVKTEKREKTCPNVNALDFLITDRIWNLNSEHDKRPLDHFPTCSNNLVFEHEFIVLEGDHVKKYVTTTWEVKYRVSAQICIIKRLAMNNVYVKGSYLETDTSEYTWIEKCPFNN